jgi:hypothetical protein
MAVIRPAGVIVKPNATRTLPPTTQAAPGSPPTMAGTAPRARPGLVTVAAWREAPYFTEAERAALALAEAATRLADSPDPVPDEVWDEAARHYDERGLAQLMLKIAVTNVFNRLNRATKQPAGAW